MAIRNIKRNKTPTELYRFVNGKKKYIKRVYKIINGKSVIVWDITDVEKDISYIYIYKYPQTEYQWVCGVMEDFDYSQAVVKARYIDGTESIIGKDEISWALLNTTDYEFKTDKAFLATYSKNGQSFSATVVASWRHYYFKIGFLLEDNLRFTPRKFFDNDDVNYADYYWNISGTWATASDTHDRIRFPNTSFYYWIYGSSSYRYNQINFTADNISDFPYTANDTALLKSIIKIIYIPDFVTEIKSGAFNNLTNLDTLFVPRSVKTIRSGAFTGCTQLSAIKIPAETTIENGAFESGIYTKIERYTTERLA